MDTGCRSWYTDSVSRCQWRSWILWRLLIWEISVRYIWRRFTTNSWCWVSYLSRTAIIAKLIWLFLAVPLFQVLIWTESLVHRVNVSSANAQKDSVFTTINVWHRDPMWTCVQDHNLVHNSYSGFWPMIHICLICTYIHVTLDAECSVLLLTVTMQEDLSMLGNYHLASLSRFLIGPR